MYQLKSALVKSKVKGTPHAERDLSNYPVRNLLVEFAEVYLVLTHFALPGEHTLKVTDIRNRFGAANDTMTLTQWLVENDRTALPTVPGKPVVDRGHVYCRDIWQAGYKATLAISNGNPANDAPDSEKADIWLTRPDTDYVDLANHALPTVNGLVHRLSADNLGAYIMNGGSTYQLANKAHLGLLSFKGIGKITTETITADMLYTPHPTGSFSSSVYIKLPRPAVNQVVGVVIGGFLHLGSEDIVRVGDNSVKVRINRLPIMERVMEVRKEMDLSSLERFYMPSEDDPEVYLTQGFYSDECITELMTLPQSFLVYIDTPELNTEHITLMNAHLPGRFYTHQEPNYPLRTELGKLPAYVSFEEAGIWVVCIENNLHQKRVFRTVTDEYGVVTEQRESDQPVMFHRGDLIDWSRETVSIKQ